MRQQPLRYSSVAHSQGPQLAGHLHVFDLALFAIELEQAFCFLQTRQFYVAAKAFDVLERLDPSPEFWEGKRGACVGLFQRIVAGQEPRYISSSLLSK